MKNKYLLLPILCLLTLSNCTDTLKDTSFPSDELLSNEYEVEISGFNNSMFEEKLRKEVNLVQKIHLVSSDQNYADVILKKDSEKDVSLTLRRIEKRIYSVNIRLESYYQYYLTLNMNVETPFLEVKLKDVKLIKYEFSHKNFKWEMTEGIYETFDLFAEEHKEIPQIYIPLVANLIKFLDDSIRDDIIESENTFLKSETTSNGIGVLQPCETSSLWANTASGCVPGSSVEYSSWVHTNAALCCFYSNQDLQSDCSNAICIGCCMNLGCNTSCAHGDYICYCASYGLPCDVSACQPWEGC